MPPPSSAPICPRRRQASKPTARQMGSPNSRPCCRGRGPFRLSALAGGERRGDGWQWGQPTGKTNAEGVIATATRQDDTTGLKERLMTRSARFGAVVCSLGLTLDAGAAAAQDVRSAAPRAPKEYTIEQFLDTVAIRGASFSA